MRNLKTPLVPLVAAAVLATIALPSFAQSAAERFSGSWHWMFNGKSFATLNLAHDGSGYTGSLTGTHIELNDDGSLREAEPSSDAKPSPIKKAWLDGSDLHISIMDGDDPMEWIVTLKDATHGQIRLADSPGAPNMKPILLEKAE